MAVLMPTFTMAQSVFDGTWKTDLSSAKFPQKPDEYLLKDGTYQCETCVPPIQVKADGQDQKVTGQPYYLKPAHSDLVIVTKRPVYALGAML